MGSRSFSLKDIAVKAKSSHQLGSSGMQPIFPEEQKEDEKGQVHNFINKEEPVKTKSADDEQESTVNSERLKPRKAVPILKDTNAPRPTGPTLRPKTIQSHDLQVAEVSVRKCSSGHVEPPIAQTTTHNPIAPKNAPFEARYDRITTYLEKPLSRRVHELHQSGQIAKMASLLNAAVREYLDQHYPS
jgi:hypothetical protein